MAIVLMDGSHLLYIIRINPLFSIFQCKFQQKIVGFSIFQCGFSFTLSHNFLIL